MLGERQHPLLALLVLLGQGAAIRLDQFQFGGRRSDRTGSDQQRSLTVE